MESVETFMQNYLAAWMGMCRRRVQYISPFYEEYFSTDYIARYQKDEHGRLEINGRAHFIILSINANDDGADVITSERRAWDTESRRRRYHLVGSAETGWRIDRKGYECRRCKGAGVFVKQRCTLCRGIGWSYYNASNRQGKIKLIHKK